MGHLDLKFYLSIFLRRLPYFLVIATFVSAIGITVASILPASYSASATILVESPQIPGDLAQSTVPVNPVEQTQIIERRLMTRANLLSLASKFGIHAGQPGMSADAIVEDMRSRIWVVASAPGPRKGPGATTVAVGFASSDPRQAADVTNELVTLILQENVSLRTNRAGDTLAFFESEAERLSGELDRLSNRIMKFKSANQDALPDSLGFRRNQQTTMQERLIQLQREETALRDYSREGHPHIRADRPARANGRARKRRRRRTCRRCSASCSRRRPSTRPPTRASGCSRSGLQRCRSGWTSSVPSRPRSSMACRSSISSSQRSTGG